MTLKAVVNVEVVKNDRVYTFSMPVGAPYGEAYDAAFEAKQVVLDLLNKSQEADKPADDQAPAEEVPATVVN